MGHWETNQEISHPNNPVPEVVLTLVSTLKTIYTKSLLECHKVCVYVCHCFEVKAPTGTKILVFTNSWCQVQEFNIWLIEPCNNFAFKRKSKTDGIIIVSSSSISCVLLWWKLSLGILNFDPVPATVIWLISMNISPGVQHAMEGYKTHFWNFFVELFIFILSLFKFC